MQNKLVVFFVLFCSFLYSNNVLKLKISISKSDVKMNEIPNSGIENTNNRPFCSNEGTLDLNSLLTGAQTGGVWTYNDNPTPISNNLNLATAQSGKYTYTVSSNSNDAEFVFTNIQISIHQAPNLGNSLDPVIRRVCMSDVNSTSINLFNEFSGATSINGVWTPNPAISGTGNNAVLNLSGLAVGSYTYTYTVVGTGACSATTTTRDVIVIVESNNLTSGTPVSIRNIVCASQASFDLHDLLIGEDMIGGTWTFNNAPLVSTIFDPATSPAGNYRYAVSSVSCNAISTPVNITIEIRNVLPIANSITATANSVCSGSSTSITFNGTPDAIITYQVNGGSIQTVTLDSTGSGVVQTGNLSTNATYKAVSVSYPGPLACTQVVGANVNTTVNVNPLPTATISGAAFICSGTGTNIKVTGTANATVTYNINGGSSQTVVLDGSGNALFATGNLASDVTYNLVSVSESVNGCSQTISGQSVKVNVTKLTTPIIAQTANTCYNTPAVINVLGGSANATLTYTIDGGATQNIVLDANGAGQIITGNLIDNAMINLTNMATGGVNPCYKALNIVNEIKIDCLSIDENIFNDSFSIHPNPTTNQLTLTHTESIKKASVYNYLGQLVLTQNGYENNMQLNVSNLPNGNYLVKIESASEAQTVKFVKE